LTWTLRTLIPYEKQIKIATSMGIAQTSVAGAAAALVTSVAFGFQGGDGDGLNQAFARLVPCRHSVQIADGPVPIIEVEFFDLPYFPVKAVQFVTL
jgi:hypothetical protein